MKKVFSMCLGFFFTILTHAQPPEGNANPGDSYGNGASATGAVTPAELLGKLKNDKPVHAKIRARVLDVCPNKGCWLKVKMNDSTTAFVKMKDYAFFVPTAAKGKNIIVDGTAFVKTTSVAELKHYAEDAKKSKEEIEAITKSRQEIHITATGISVVK